MPISCGGIGPGIINKTTPGNILALEKSIDDNLATVKRIAADLTKEKNEF